MMVVVWSWCVWGGGVGAVVVGVWEGGVEGDCTLPPLVAAHAAPASKWCQRSCCSAELPAC